MHNNITIGKVLPIQPPDGWGTYDASRETKDERKSAQGMGTKNIMLGSGGDHFSSGTENRDGREAKKMELRLKCTRVSWSIP